MHGILQADRERGTGNNLSICAFIYFFKILVSCNLFRGLSFAYSDNQAKLKDLSGSSRSIKLINSSLRPIVELLKALLGSWVSEFSFDYLETCLFKATGTGRVDSSAYI